MRRGDNPIIMENINLAYAVAQSFYCTTGIDIEELLSEATVAYLEALTVFNPKKGKLSTLVYHCVQNRLCDFCKEQNVLETRMANNKPIPQTHSQRRASIFDSAIFHEMMNSSPSTKKIFNLIMENPHQYMKWGGRGEVKKQLRKLGWTWESIWTGFREIKRVLKESRAI